MQQISRHDIYSIFLDIARTFPIDARYKIETYHLIGKLPDDYTQPNLGKTYQDAENGYFWNRDWEAEGKPIDGLKYSYPVLGVEAAEVKLSAECDKTEVEYDFYISLVDQVVRECGCERTEQMVKEDLYKMMMSIWAKFKTYRLVTICINTKEVNHWLSEEHLKFIELNPDKFDFEVKAQCLEICSAIVNNEVSISPLYTNFLNGGIGLAMNFRVKDCVGQEFDYNYCPPSKQTPQLAKAYCSIC